MRNRITTALALSAVAAVTVLTGCASGGDPSVTPESTVTPTAGPDPEPTTASSEATTVEVMSTSLGDVLVDGDGMTLYMFDSDLEGVSTCYDTCAANWPPVLVSGEAMAGQGADAALLGVTTRNDGGMQATYGGWPLYYFALDAVPGDVAGQAVSDVWWVLGADGQPIRD